MNWMKRTAIVLATGAALSLPASINASAAPVGQAAGVVNTLNSASAAQSESNLIEVGRRGRGYGRHGGYRRHGGWGRHRYGYRRHRGHGWGLAAGLLAAPLIYGAYDNGYGYSGYGGGYGGGSCYRECRYYHGPRYCRWNANRYC